MTTPCNFLGCTNPTPGDYPWQMCDTCAYEAWDIEDSNLHDLDDVAAEFGINLT